MTASMKIEPWKEYGIGIQNLFLYMYISVIVVIIIITILWIKNHYHSKIVYDLFETIYFWFVQLEDDVKVLSWHQCRSSSHKGGDSNASINNRLEGKLKEPFPLKWII